MQWLYCEIQNNSQSFIESQVERQSEWGTFYMGSQTLYHYLIFIEYKNGFYAVTLEKPKSFDTVLKEFKIL